MRPWCAHQPHSIILLPQMLRAWVGYLMHERAARPGDRCELVAVGGAAVGARLLHRRARVGIPAYEGYGLSEGASVQTLNLPGADRPGSAGRRLAARAAARGGRRRDRDRGQPVCRLSRRPPSHRPHGGPPATSGAIDADGFVHVSGRKKHVLITAFGRNVSPEWVETALRSENAIAQAVVFGDGQPALSAVLWPVRPTRPTPPCRPLSTRANATLPDYARMQRWVRAGAPSAPHPGLATANGRPQRTAILQQHADALGMRPSDPSPSIRIPHEFPCPTARTDRRRPPGTARHTRSSRAACAARCRCPATWPFCARPTTTCGTRCRCCRPARRPLPARYAWLRGPLDEYVDEEQGHEEWILDDIRACGGDAERCATVAPGHATEIMVAYAYDTIARRNPLGFFGMVHVLEGTSVSLALLAADRIQQPLRLPDAAFSYLRSHGTLDQEHTAHFALLMDRIEDPQDQADIVHAARAFYRLYADVFRSLPSEWLSAPLPRSGAHESPRRARGAHRRCGGIGPRRRPPS